MKNIAMYFEPTQSSHFTSRLHLVYAGHQDHFSVAVKLLSSLCWHASTSRIIIVGTSNIRNHDFSVWLAAEYAVTYIRLPIFAYNGYPINNALGGKVLLSAIFEYWSKINYFGAEVRRMVASFGATCWCIGSDQVFDPLSFFESLNREPTVKVHVLRAGSLISRALPKTSYTSIDKQIVDLMTKMTGKIIDLKVNDMWFTYGVSEACIVDFSDLSADALAVHYFPVKYVDLMCLKHITGNTFIGIINITLPSELSDCPLGGNNDCIYIDRVIELVLQNKCKLLLIKLHPSATKDECMAAEVLLNHSFLRHVGSATIKLLYLKSSVPVECYVSKSLAMGFANVQYYSVYSTSEVVCHSLGAKVFSLVNAYPRRLLDSAKLRLCASVHRKRSFKHRLLWKYINFV